MVTTYTLTVFQSDDTTPWFEVSTDPEHAAPYLHLPGEYDQGEVDLLNGRALVGEIQLRIIDPQIGADQSERWLTERLGVPAGQDGAGHSAVNGRRGRLVDGDGNVVLDGVATGVRLSESFAGFHLGLRDIRERHRRISLFSRTGTATVLPRGVLNGYGQLPSGEWLIPPTKPLPAVWHGSSGLFGQSGIFDLSGLWDGRPLDGSRTAKAPPVLVLTEAMRKVTSFAMVGGFVPMPVYRDVEVWWRRTSGDTSWKVIRNIRPRGASPHPLLLNATRARVEGVDGEIAAIHSIGIAAGGFGGTAAEVPNDGESVEVLILYVGPPTEDYPYHYEGTAGDLLSALYDGTYSESPITDRVDAAALTALTTPVRLRLTEAPKADRSREWIEEAYKQLRAAAALDRSGRIAPVTAALPDATEVLEELTDQVCQPIPGWDHPATDAITAVRITYPRDYRVPVDDDPLGERSAGDGIASIDVTVERRAPEWVIDLMGEQVHEIDGWLFRALGIIGSAGTIDPASGDVSDETGHQEAERAARELLDRWVFGGQVSFARVMRSALPDLKAGQWVIDKRSWRPNYREGKRGGASLAQIMSVRALSPAWLEVSLVDAGPADQPLTAPTLGTPSVSDDGIVTIPVTAVPTGGEAAVYIAVATTAPAWDSGAWRLAGRIGATGDVLTPPQPAGAKVWITSRGEGLGRRPSATTTPVSVQVPSVPRLREVRVTLAADGTPTFHWQPNHAAAGVRIAYRMHDAESDPTGPATTVDVEASALEHELAATVPPGQAITATLTPYTGWTGSAVSGTAGPAVERSAARPAEPVETLPPTCDIERVSRTATTETIRYVGEVGTGGTGPLQYQRRIDAGSWSTWAALPSGGVQEAIPRPSKTDSVVALRVRDADGVVSRPLVMYVVPARLPIIDDDGRLKPDEPATGEPGAPAFRDVVDGAGRATSGLDSQGRVRLREASDGSTLDTVEDRVLHTQRWRQTPSVNTATPAKIANADGSTPLATGQGGVSYTCTAKTLGTSTNTSAIAVFRHRSGVWTLERLYERGRTSNHPEFFLDADGHPAIRLYNHTTLYTVEVIVEGTATDEAPSEWAGRARRTIEPGGRVLSEGVVALDGAGSKLLPKGVTGGTAVNGQYIEFEEPYDSPPIVIFSGGATDEGRAKWSSDIDVADDGNGTDPRPTNALIAQAMGADVSASGFWARLRLVAKSAPVQRSASFTSPLTIDSVGQFCGPATPASAQVPSTDGKYTASFSAEFTNLSLTDPLIIAVHVALDVRINAGAWAEAGTLWVNQNVPPGPPVAISRSITATVSNISGGDDTFRLRIKAVNISSGSGGVAVTADELRWSQDAGAKYATMTPGGAADAVPFFVIAQG